MDLRGAKVKRRRTEREKRTEKRKGQTNENMK